MATTKRSPLRRLRLPAVEGSLLEVCSCEALCPCWIGEDPDSGPCQSVVAYHFDRARSGRRRERAERS